MSTARPPDAAAPRAGVASGGPDSSLPWRQSAGMRKMVAAAGPGGFAVPRCRACQHRFYPSQSWCPACLACNVEYAADTGAAIVGSATQLRISLDTTWKSRLPLHIACVRTESGIPLFALADRALATGTPVRIEFAEATPDLPTLFWASTRG